jgi:beta-glucanase (GH16 family)
LEQFETTTTPDGAIAFRSSHGKYVFADMQGRLRAVADGVGEWEKFSVISCELPQSVPNCTTEAFAVDYSPERCSWSKAVTTMACTSSAAGECGLRISSNQSFGAGRFSTRMKAAPGPGTATNFYLYTYGRQNSKSDPWNEIDFEVLGKHVGQSGSRLWTNFFVGKGTQFPQWIDVPFNASADFHAYTIEVTCCSISWIVDAVTYRRAEFNMWQHADMTQSIRSSNFQVLLSFWGQNKTSGEWSDIGYLDDNMNAFPIYASYQGLNLPAANTCSEATSSCAR